MNEVTQFPELKSASLYYKEGGSGKVYQFTIGPAGERFTERSNIHN